MPSLGDVSDLTMGFPFQSARFSSASTDVRLLRGDNVQQRRIEWEGAARWPTVGVELPGYHLAVDDVVLAMDRPWVSAGLKVARIQPSDTPALLVQRVARLRGRPQVIAPKLLYYVLCSPEFTNHIREAETGTSIPHISGGQIKAYRFDLPDRADQDAIAALLGALDDKIEINRRMNRTLEELSQALFKSWFVDFDPVHAKAAGRRPFGMDDATAALFPSGFGGEVPKGWSLSPSDSLLRILAGGTPPRGRADCWGGGVPWFSIADAPQSGDVFVHSTAESITSLGTEISSATQYPTGTVILTARGTVGKVALAGTSMAFNQSCFGLTPIGGGGQAFGYCLTRSLVAELRQMAHGSVFDTINRQTFATLTCPSSPAALRDAFEGAAASWFDLIRTNGRESRTLASLRDLLLPKLLSGEIRLKQAENLVAGAL